MSYKVTWVTTKPDSSIPDFYDWVCSLPDNYMDPYTTSEGPFTAAAGKTPKQIMDEVYAQCKYMTGPVDPSSGVLSKIPAVRSEDGKTITTEIIFDSKETWDEVSAKGNVPTAAKYLQDSYATENNVTVTITGTEI